MSHLSRRRRAHQTDPKFDFKKAAPPKGREAAIARPELIPKDENPLVVEQDPSTKLYHCVVCDRAFQKPAGLKIHYSRMEGRCGSI